MTKKITNKFAAICNKCGENVGVGLGLTYLAPSGSKSKWLTEHAICGDLLSTTDASRDDFDNLNMEIPEKDNYYFDDDFDPEYE